MRKSRRFKSVQPVVLSSRHFNQSLGIVVRAVVEKIHSFNQSRERTLRKHGFGFSRTIK
jgi:hypothetical protein